MKLMLAVDIGTSAARALVFDEAANLVAQVRLGYPMTFPQTGWSEQDPDTVANAVIAVLQEAVRGLPARSQLEAVVFSSQMYSVLAVDREGNPLSNSLTWGDTRSAALAATIRNHVTARELVATNGCPIQSIYPLSKILWLKQNLDLPPDAKFISIKDYVLFRLTGQFMTDWSIASASGLLQVATNRWDDTALSIAQITHSNLPELYSPRHVMTDWQPEIIKHIGVPSGTPLIMGAGDAPLANIGVGAIHLKTLAVNLGTSAAARVLITTPQIDPSGRLWTYIADEGYWVTGGIIGGGGAVYEWLLNKQIFHDHDYSLAQLYSEADRLANSVEAGADGLMFIPYFTGEQSPGWNPSARGAVYGLSFQHEPKHYIRATLEGIVYSLLRVSSTLEEIRAETVDRLYVTGGLTASSVCLQILAHVFGVPVMVPQTPESSARGAAIVGWLALGHGQDYNTFHPQAAEQEEQIIPDTALHTFYRQKYQEFCALNDRVQSRHY